MLALKIALGFMTIVCLVMIGIIYYLSGQKRQPISGETASNNIIYVKVCSPVYKNFEDDLHIGLISHYLSNSLEINSSLVIPLRYYAISENGRFCVHVGEEKLWVYPGEEFSYSVYATKVKPKKSSKKNKK